MKLRTVDPRTVTIPAVRVTMVMEPEAEAQLRESVKTLGVLEPPLVMDTGTELICVDGRHRLEEAIAAGVKTLQVAVREGSVADAALQNLVTSVARGKPRVADLVRVVGNLYSEHKVPIEDLVTRTGLSQNYVERLITICEAGPELVEPLDAGLMGIGHAYLIARVVDRDTRARLIHQQLVYHFTVERLRAHIQETERIAAEPVAVPVPVEVAPPTMIRCAGCGGLFSDGDIAPQPICRGCDGALWSAQHTNAPVGGQS